jgi:transcriptional regulator with XRE-family HTH domain
MQKMAHVEGMAGTIEARRLALGLTVQDLIEQTGLTRPGLAPLLRGERRRYQERLTLPICRALKWTPDSIERLLAGEQPIELEPITRPDELSALRAQVGELTTLVSELAATVATLGDEVAQLRGRPPRPALGTP